MKTFADFLVEAKKTAYAKVYAAKVSNVRQRQDDYVRAHKDKIKQKIQKQVEAADRKKEEENENQEYISQIEGLKKEIRKEIKKN